MSLSQVRIIRQQGRFLDRYNECLTALETYMAEAHKLCDLLEACNGNAATVAEHLELAAQRDRENDSCLDYRRARSRLLHTAWLNSR